MLTLAGVLAVSSGCASLRFWENEATPRPVALRVYVAQRTPCDGCERTTDDAGETLYVHADAIATDVDVREAGALHSTERSILLVWFNFVAAARLQRETAAHAGDELAIYVDDKLSLTADIDAPMTEGGLGLDLGWSRARVEAAVRWFNDPERKHVPER